MLVSQFFLLFFRLLCYTVPVTMISMKEEVIIMEKLMSVDLGAGNAGNTKLLVSACMGH